MKKCKIDMATKKLKCDGGEEIGIDDLKERNCDLDKANRRVKCPDGDEYQL